MVEAFFDKGWHVFPPETALLTWVEAARKSAVAALGNPDFAQWYQCDGTWFVGLDALDNDAQGRVAGSPPLSGRAVDFIAKHLGGWPALHRAQVSGVFSGYPRPRDDESEAGFRYRRDRDAAHVDGVIGVGHPKRRFVQEPHAFILGMPLTQAEDTAAPLVVWDGSHIIMQKAFRDAFSVPSGQVAETLDITETYHAARREVFATCTRRVVHGPPGAAIVVHPLALHGVAPWQPGAEAADEGRLIAYFRPLMPGGAAAWSRIGEKYQPSS